MPPDAMLSMASFAFALRRFFPTRQIRHADATLFRMPAFDARLSLLFT